tara:strand:- start:29 stop:940 length:912 start_codon:yes stop_codon:yes gene_type:complete
MTTGLLGDTPFLDLLQDYTVKFNNRVESNPFGNYSNFQASDFVNTPFGQPIAQNTFEGNQFQMPDLTGSTYTPGNFSLAPGAGFNFGNMGTYTPGAFNQFFQAPMTSPAMARTTTRTGGGDGYENLQRFLGNRPGVSTEFVGDRGFRINEDGTVSMLDPDSLDYKLNNLAKGLLSATPSNLLGKFLQGTPTTAQRATVNPNNAVYDRIAKTYGEETAQNFMQLNAEAINKELQSDEYKKMMSDLQAKATTPSGALTSEQADVARRRASQGGRKTSEGLDRARERSKDAAAKATGKSRGFFGGR